MKIAFLASTKTLAQKAKAELVARYGDVPIDAADVVVSLGGDGQVLHTLRQIKGMGIPVYPWRQTDSVGFLCNEVGNDDLIEKLVKAEKVILHPLKVQARTKNGLHIDHSINEISVRRITEQSARLDITINGINQIKGLFGDGALVATPAGSTAYNMACGGPILPLNSNLLVITGICCKIPKDINSGRLLDENSIVTIDVLESEKRPVAVTAGGSEDIIHVLSAEISLDMSIEFTLLFDPAYHLSKKILDAQFPTNTM